MNASTRSLLYSFEEEQLAEVIRSVMSDHALPGSALRYVESDQPYDLTLWSVLTEQVGVAELAQPASRGDAGGSWREIAVVAEELGRAVAPAPFFGDVVLVPAVLRAAGVALEGAAKRPATLAVPLTTAPGTKFTPTVSAGEGVLNGTVTSVIDAADAGSVLVPAAEPSGIGLYAVDAARVSRAAVTSLDLTRPLSDLTFSAVPGRRLGAADVDAAVTAGAAMLASEQLGLAEHCLDSTVAYLRSRVQFGRPLGSFQALKHRLAELWVSVTRARAAARYAADCLAGEDADTPVAVAVAAAHCAAVATDAAEECVQLHGGIGFTWEHPAHLYLARAKADSLAFGTAEHHRRRLSSLVDIPL